MAANIEHQVICKIIETQDFHTVTKLKIDDTFFLSDSQTKEAFRFMWEHYHNEHTYGSVPSWQLLQQRFYGFPWSYSYDTLASLCQELRRYKMRADILSFTDEISQVVDTDPSQAMAILREAVTRLSTQHEITSDLLLSNAYEQLYTDYNTVANAQGVTGIPFPWDLLNEDTQGMHPSQFIVLYGRPKSMKCVVEGQKIMMKDGSLVPIEKVPEHTMVPSYTEKDGKIRWAKARRVNSGVKNSVEVTTESGLRLRTSTEHLYMVPGGGYARICDLLPGSYIATSRILPNWEPTSSIEPGEAQLLGLLTGDGNYTRSEIQFTTADDEILQTVKSLASTLFDCDTNVAGRPIEYRITGRGEHRKNKLLDRLRELGVHGKKSTQKEVPEDLFRASKSAIASFLAALIDTDGHVSSNWVAWNSSSRKLLEGVQHLLMRFGVRGRIKEVVTNYGTLSYVLYVYSKEQHVILAINIGLKLCLSVKRNALLRLANLDITEKRNVDSIPYNDLLLAKILMAKSNMPWPKWNTSKLDAGKLFRRSGNISRHLLQKLANEFSSAELYKESNNEIIWERIDSIESLSFLPCYDICIEDGQDPNFVVEGFIVHNTWIALVIACFAYLRGMRVLIWSLEMNETQLLKRIACIICQVDYDKFKKGKLDPATQQRVWQVLMAIRDEELVKVNHSGHAPALLVVHPRGDTNGVSSLQAKIREFKPDLALVDGMYLMRDDRQKVRSIDWKAITHISQDLKRTASLFQIPIIGVTQANRGADKDPKKADLMELSYSDALAQDCDLCMRVHKQKDPASQDWEIVLSIPGGRDTQLDGFVVYGCAATNFGFKRATITDPNNPQPQQNSGNKKSGGGGGNSNNGPPALPGWGRS